MYFIGVFPLIFVFFQSGVVGVYRKRKVYNIQFTYCRVEVCRFFRLSLWLWVYSTVMNIITHIRYAQINSKIDCGDSWSRNAFFPGVTFHPGSSSQECKFLGKLIPGMHIFREAQPRNATFQGSSSPDCNISGKISPGMQHFRKLSPGMQCFKEAQPRNSDFQGSLAPECSISGKLSPRMQHFRKAQPQNAKFQGNSAP